MLGLALIGLAVLTPLAMEAFNPALLLPPEPNPDLALWGTVALVYTGFAGVTKVAAIAEEVKNPSKTLPLGMLLSLGRPAVLHRFVRARRDPRRVCCSGRGAPRSARNGG